MIKNEDFDDDYIEIKYRRLTPAIEQIIEICEGEKVVLICEKDVG